MKNIDEDKMKNLDEDIRTGNFRRAYLIYGTEDYLRCQYRDRLRQALLGNGDAMNLLVLQEPPESLDEVLDFAETVPFFAERRVIVMEDSGLFGKTRKKKKDEDEAADEEDAGKDTNRLAKQLAEYLADVSDTTTFVFVEKEANSAGKLYKAVAKVGAIVECTKQTPQTIARWVLRRVRRENKNITQGAYDEFISRTGMDMQNIDVELDKLLSYTMDKDAIRVEDVRAVTSTRVENQVYAMVDAIAQHKQEEALQLYYDLLALKIPPVLIMFRINQHFRLLLTVKALINQGMSDGDIAARITRPEWTVKRQYRPQCRNLSMDTIKRALRDGAEYETAFKEGNLKEETAVELLIVGASQPDHAHTAP